MLHLYCVRGASDPGPVPALVGVDEEPVRLLVDGALGAWVSKAADAPATVQRLRQHEAVVRAALRTATPLPVRYGTHVRTEGELREVLRDRAAEFTATLRRLDGRVEMGLRLEWDEPPAAPPPAAPPASGRDYLEARRREHTAEQERRERAEALLEQVEAQLADLELPSRRTPLPRPGVAGLVAHLVRRGRVAEYRQRVHRLRLHAPHRRVVPSGPWAPYSFV